MSPIEETWTRLTRHLDLQTAGQWLLLGALVGAVSGIGALLLQVGIQAISAWLLIGVAGLEPLSPAGEPNPFQREPGAFHPLMIVLLPAIGGLLSGQISHWFAPEVAGAGANAAIDAWHNRTGRIRARVPWAKIAATSLSIGTGGSGGKEGPIAQIGAGFGSWLADRLHLTTRNRRILLAAGLGGGVGSIFRAPLAGALFASEVLYSSAEVEAEVLLPAAVSSIVAYTVYSMGYGYGHMFEGTERLAFTNPVELVPYTVLALLLAASAYGWVRLVREVQGRFAATRFHPSLRPAVGGFATGFTGLVLLGATRRSPGVEDVLSSGYGIIQRILDDGTGIPILLLLVVAGGKMLTSALTIGSGGSAGVFGPSMVIGATLGAAVGRVFHAIAPGTVEAPASFAIVGMAGFFAAAAKTPLSTVVMVSELTGNYQLLVPTMWVCALSFLASREWTIFPAQVPTRLQSPAHLGDHVRDVFGGRSVRDVFRKTRGFVALEPQMTLAHVFDLTQGSRQRVFPVIDGSSRRFLGSFRLDDLAGALHDADIDLARSTAGDLVKGDALVVRETDPVLVAWRALRRASVEEVIVLGADDAVTGILTSADLLLAYTRGVAGRRRVETGTGAPERVEPPPR